MSELLVNGRPLDEHRKKCLRELAEQKAEAGRQRLEAERRAEAERQGAGKPTSPITPSTSATFQIPSSDDFSIDDIVKTPQGDFEFRGLLTPEGLWESITLAGRQFENDKRLDYHQWFQYSNGTHGFVGDDFVELDNPVERDFRVTPARVRYWLMRAVVEKTNSPKHASVVSELTQLFHKDDHSPWQHNAELITYRAGQNAIIATRGWPQDHPFTRSVEYHLAGNSVEIVQGCQIGGELYVIAGDNNPARVKQVVEYHDKPTGTTYLWRCRTDFSGMRVVMFGSVSGSFIGCGGGGIMYDRRPARGVRADINDFHKK